MKIRQTMVELHDYVGHEDHHVFAATCQRLPGGRAWVLSYWCQECAKGWGRTRYDAEHDREIIRRGVVRWTSDYEYVESKSASDNDLDEGS